MNFALSVWRSLATLALLAALALPAAGQSVLFTDEDGKVLPVRAARGTIAYVKVNGALVAATGTRFGLKDVSEYLPVVVDVRNLKVGTTYMTFRNDAHAINNELNVTAEFESAVRLDDVFLVLELDTEAGRSLFLWEVGTLLPHDPSKVSIKVPATFELGSGQFKLHVFSGGAEVLNSNLGYLYIDGKLDEMVAKRIRDVQDAQLRPFIHPSPEYPRRLKKAKVEGEAVVTVRVNGRGSVSDPVVKNATDPAFAQAALDAIKQWRFLPRVRNGIAQEVVVDVPFVFSLPKGF